MQRLKIRNFPSQNFDDRRLVGGLKSIRHIVIHYTGMDTAASAIERLCDPASRVSSHYMIDEKGTVYVLVDENHRAWHAGIAYWDGIRDINSTSIGIELANPGHENGYRAFTEAQMFSLETLLNEILARHSISPKNVLGHSDIAPGRKADPGELFDWERLGAAGIVLWPTSISQSGDLPESKPDDSLRNLASIGYAVPGKMAFGGDILHSVSGVTDVICAFQRRFRPSLCDGNWDAETHALSSIVAQLYNS